MTSYEIGSNSSRYPYDYSFVTDGTNGEYTDQTESSFILPTITAADANKFLEVNDTATGYQYTEIEGELPPQAGQTGKFLETNGTSVFWDTVNQVPGATAGNSGQYLTNDGSTARWASNPTLVNNVLTCSVPINITHTGVTGDCSIRFNDPDNNSGINGADNTIELVAGGTVRLRCNANGVVALSRVTCVNGVADSDGIMGANMASSGIRFLRTINNPISGQELNQVIMRACGTNCLTVSGNMITSGAAPVADSQKIDVAVPMLLSDGTTGAVALGFINSTNSGLVRALVGADNGIGFVANGTQVCSIVGGNIRLSGGSSLRNNVSNPSSNIQFIGSTGGATGNIQMTFVDNYSGVVNTAQYRLGNGENFQATETVMSRLRGGTGTNEIFATEHGNTYFRFLGATGTGANLPARVQRVEINNSGMSVSGDLTVSGNISGNISTPSLLKKVEIVPGGTASAYIYTTSNTSPATLLLSENITENKLVTLDNMGASFDGFEMEYQILGNSNDMQYGVRFTLVQPRGFIFPRDGRPVIKNTTANYTTATDNLFQNITNNFRVRATFVWAGSAANCYWIVRDITEYGRIVTGRFTSTGDYTINLNSPRYLILNRNTSTRNIIFPDLKQSSSWLGEAGGFEMRIVSYIFGGTGPDITFTNGATAGSGTQMVVIGSGSAENKAPGESITAFSGSLARQYDCVFTELIGGQFGWLLTRYGG
jgi:hypothetical protein